MTDLFWCDECLAMMPSSGTHPRIERCWFARALAGVASLLVVAAIRAQMRANRRRGLVVPIEKYRNARDLR